MGVVLPLSGRYLFCNVASTAGQDADGTPGVFSPKKYTRVGNLGSHRGKNRV
jgi:hypothetical protein